MKPSEYWNHMHKTEGGIFSASHAARPEEGFADDGRAPSLSVIVCTYNRAELLRMTLDSLAGQTLDRSRYEVIVIDDGSQDETRQCVESFSERLHIKYFFQKNAGLASAKNHGIFASRGEILFFMDDDDIAAPTLLEEHLKTHESYPDSNYAVLNYTTWEPGLPVTPLMHFVAEVGCFLFYYPYIKHGDILDYTYFWGGRSSCKRAFLIEHGVFNAVFRFGCEDIELGYRLSKHGLKVVYNRKAVSYMTRPIGFDDFCSRLVKQGRSQYVFSSLHDDPVVRRLTEVLGWEGSWDRIRKIYEAKRNSARGLDRIADAKLQLNLGLDDETRKLLYRAYWWVFRASRLKGISEMAGQSVTGPAEGGDSAAALPGAGEAAGGADALGIWATGNPEIDLTRTFNYDKLVDEEIEEYSNIEVTEDLREGGIHAQNAWGYWFRYLAEQVWKTSLKDEIINACNDSGDGRILSLGCGYCGTELEVARAFESLNRQYEIVAVDINRDLFARAENEVRGKGLNVRFGSVDLNFLQLEENAFDIIFAHASLHHLLNLEHVFSQIHRGLKSDGRLIIQDIIGKTQVLFWKENVDFARELVEKMPPKYKKGIVDQANIILPYRETSLQKGMEGIRQEEIPEQVNRYFTAIKLFEYGSFMRLVCTNPELGKRFDPDNEEDREYLEYLFQLDLKQIDTKRLRPTEMLGVFEKKKGR